MAISYFDQEEMRRHLMYEKQRMREQLEYEYKQRYLLQEPEKYLGQTVISKSDPVNPMFNPLLLLLES